jgi:HAD superfamily phosphoserine phosphatase-like hydrolase
MLNIKLIAFDVDGTLTVGNKWEQLHSFCGITPEEDYLWFKKHEEGKVTFQEWNNFVEKKYRSSNKTKSQIQQVATNFQLFDDVRETISQLSLLYKIALISSGFDVFVQAVASQLNVTQWYANYSFEYSSSARISKIHRKYEDATAKVQALDELTKMYDLSPTQIAFVGDSSNDIKAFEYTSRGILKSSSNHSKLASASWKQIEKISDLLKIFNTKP